MAYRPYPGVGRARRQVARHSPSICGRYIGRGEYCDYPTAPGLTTCAFHGGWSGMANMRCAHCGLEVEDRGHPFMDGNHEVRWVHVPGGYAVCHPQRPADSSRATPVAARPTPRDGR